MPRKPERSDPTFDKLLLLDRLEELLDEMEELGVRSIEEVERRIAELELEVSDEGDDGSV